MPKREFATLAHSLDPRRGVIGWMVSRKLNGWGCVWDGGVTRGLLAVDVPWYYRGADRPDLKSTGLWTIGRGNKPKVVNAPDWFIDNLPNGLPVQGELWCGDDLQKVKQICGQGIRGRSDKRWDQIKFMVYNVKSYSEWEGFSYLVNSKEHLNGPFGKNQTWQTRMGVAKMLHHENDYWLFHEQEVVESLSHIMLRKNDVLHFGWEGLVFVNPKSFYESFRSHNVLKWKPEFDIEAEVVGYEDGKTGKNIGRLGAVICRMFWDEKVLTFTGGKESFIGKRVVFKVSGWSDEEREWEWIKATYPIGSELHFTFSGVSENGIPLSCNRVSQ